MPRERMKTPYGYGSKDIIPCSGAKLGSETVLESRDDAVSELSGLLVSERLLIRLEGHREGHRLRARAHLLTPVDVERTHLPELGAGGLPGGVDERSGGNVFVDDEGEVLPDGWVGDDVLVVDDVGHRGEKRRQVELEDPPAAFEQRRMELADPARVEPGRLARMQERLLRSLDVQLDLQCIVQRLDDTLRAGEAV